MKRERDFTPADHLDFLLSPAYDGMSLHPEHLADLLKSGLTDATIARQKIRSIPPSMINQLAGFRVPPAVTSAYIGVKPMARSKTSGVVSEAVQAAWKRRRGSSGGQERGREGRRRDHASPANRRVPCDGGDPRGLPGPR
jgi:hypothetical protein